MLNNNLNIVQNIGGIKMEIKDNLKERIISSTIKLIYQCNGKVDGITMRNIAEVANVGVGLINYHFQTKEHLVDICVERLVSDFVHSFDNLIEDKTISEIDKIKKIFINLADFFIKNESIAKISILNDFTKPNNKDVTSLIIIACKKILADLMTDSLETFKINVMLQIVLSTVQSTFIRKAVNKEMIGLDFNNKTQRDMLLDVLIDSLFNNN
jgi:AcrR family transcriptional regulator